STQPTEFVGRISQLLDAPSDTDQDPTNQPPSRDLGITGDIASNAGKASGDQPSDATKESRASDSDYEARKRVAELATQSTIDPTDESISPTPFAAESASDGVGESAKSEAKGRSLDQADVQDMRTAFALTDEPQAEGTKNKTNLAHAPYTTQPVATLVPRWIKDAAGVEQLVLVRSVIIDNQPMIQGVWLDWPTLRSDLLESVDDVMPGATPVPVDGPRSAMVGGYQLATIPVEFIPPQSQLAAPWRWSPATVGLLVTWIAIIATIIAVGVVLRAAIVLSERRGRFVSAVTHELRTPLTTFRLYSQMLADGMVSDEQVRTDYLHILKRESERLTGIVENVLEYARLTRQRPTKGKPAGVQTLSPGALVARFRPALARRAGQSNLDLVVSLDLDADQDRTLTVDPHAVERIMMNLIENACKYAAPSEDDDAAIEDIDTRIHFDVSIRRNTLELLIADHGPGIPQSESAQIFGEFQRGWRGLSNARSGLGLGLALSRGLAREMGGDLILTHRRNHGAEFLLTIPLDEHPS
ncbi:MAG: sensor histidine kinase, partial [Phycisphaerales bacterium]